MKFVLRYRVFILIVLLVITAVLGIQIKNMTRDAGISALIPQDHPDYLYAREVERMFGANDQVVIGLTAKDSIYTPQVIGFLAELTWFFEGLDEIDEDDIISLTSMTDMRGDNGELIIEPLIDDEALAELDGEALLTMRERVRNNPLFYGKIVSQDERSTVFIAGVPAQISMHDEPIAALKAKISRKLAELQQKYPDVTVNFSGTAMLKAFISEYMQKDMRKLFPFTILLVAVLLFLVLRSVFGMCVPLLVTIFSIVWTFGLKGMLDSPLTIVETTIPVMLIAIGCADGIHLISEFLGFYRRGMSAPEALQNTMRLLTLPVILTSVTTAIGFASLITAPGVSIRSMGLYLAFGVMVAMTFSILFIPILLSFYRSASGRNEAKHAGAATDSLFHRIVSPLARQVLEHRKIVAASALVLLSFAVLGIFHIQVESDEVRYFKKQNAFRKSTENIQRDLGGVTSLDIVIETNEPDSLKDPGLLKTIDELQRFCEQDELVSYTLSLTDLIKRINYVLHDNDAAYDRLPGDTEQVTYEAYEEIDGEEVVVEKTEDVSGFDQIAQFLLLYDMSGGDATEQYADDVYQHGRVIVRLNDMSSQRLERLLDKLEPYVAEHFPETVRIRYANHYIRIVMTGLIIDSQIYSLLTVLVTITILMSIIFRSPVVGLITSLPVFIAVLLNFAVMWLFGVTLNVGTSIIASVGMGVGIDYTIHFFSRFRFILKETGEYDSALLKAIVETSRPILSNATAVGLGFLVLLFSEYQVIGHIGWITCLSMFTTALNSLIILPALLSLVKPNVKI